MKKFYASAIALLMLTVGNVVFGQTSKDFTVGLLMVGPYNDHGWSQAHYDGTQAAVSKIPGSKLVYLDNVNPASRPGTTASQLAESLVAKGAKMVIFSSDDMYDEAVKFALAHKDIFVISSAGDQVWKDGKAYKNIPNMVNVMGKMEYGKMIAGVAAAMTTKTGKIGYLGPLINDETRRLAASVYLGAKYAWVNYLKKDPAKLQFKVTWIGFWFNIPGVTSDPTQVADDFFNSGYDVVVSGIDTTEALTEAVKYTNAGKKVWAIPYDYEKAMSEGTAVALGVPYFNWAPAYGANIAAAKDGKWVSHFEWNGPDWKNFTGDTGAVSFKKGAALSKEAAAAVDKFVGELAGGLNLWKGPLNYQNGSTFLANGKTAGDTEIWYLPQLLQGMEGQSVAQ